MKKYLLLAVAVVILPGCGFWDSWFGGGSGGDSQATARQQLNDARASFDERIKAASGKTITQVKKEWGDLEKGLSQNDLTVYRWSQTARVTAPAGENGQSKTGQETASCLAMFIVNRNGVVVDATSEGQCFDYKLMPAWRPYIVESTDTKTGPVHR